MYWNDNTTSKADDTLFEKNFREPADKGEERTMDDPIYLVYDMSFAGHYDAVQQQVN